jgi:WXXGXW repeat (2 copies)
MKAPIGVSNGGAGAIIGSTRGNKVNHQSGTHYRIGPQNVFRERPKNLPQPPPSPATSALWVPGHWTIDDRANEWTAGHWEIPSSAAYAFLSAR